jgi:AcrR family transcriptional regulator
LSPALETVKMQSMGAPARSGSEQRRYGGRSAQERAEDRRERLVEAAISVLAAQGERATMTAICHEAGLTERYFYESFANRDAALVAALEHVCDEISANAVRVLQATSGTVDERVLAMTRDFARWAATHRDRAVVGVVHARTIAALRQRRRELLVSFAEISASEASVLYGEDAWDPDRARVQGIVFIGGLAELVAAWLAGDVTLEPDALGDVMADLFAALSRRASIS